jgi:cell wall-associated NlpC family hydrolase
LWAGISAFGFDCSGLAYTVHERHGVRIPRDVVDQAHQGRHVEPGEVLPGDLLFFAHDRGRGRLHHVGIYAGSGRMIHSPNSARSVELVELRAYELKEEFVFSRRYW